MDIQQYRVDLPEEWLYCKQRFLGGYEAEMSVGEENWRALARWGQGGNEIGSWPYIMIFISTQEGVYEIVEYQEGEYAAYRCPTIEERNAVIDELALYWWKILAKDLVAGIETIEQAPATLRGPYQR